MTREDVYEKDLLRDGDLIYFDAIPTPDMILGRHLLSGNLVDVTGLEFLNANNSMNIDSNRIINKYLKVICENITFICEFRDGKLRILEAVELLDLIVNYERNYKSKFHKNILKRYRPQRVFK